jgi:hypothetical protein
MIIFIIYGGTLPSQLFATPSAVLRGGDFALPSP